MRGWLADNPGCIDALRRYAALRAGEADGLEDAVEAEATAMFLSPDPLGDRIEMLNLVWTVKDAERLQEAMSVVAAVADRFLSIRRNSATARTRRRRPPSCCSIAPCPSRPNRSICETIPQMLAQALLFGRQTDREARLEVIGVAADELPAIDEMVREAGGEAVEPEPNHEVIGHWSASQKLLRTAWHPPRGASPEQLRAMMNEHVRDAILHRWPELKLGVLDGRSPREAAADPACRVKVLAAILVLEQWTENLPGTIDYNELRASLGLPALGPIDAKQHPIEDLPVVRLGRVSVEGLSDEDLVAAYYRAAAFTIRPALRKFAAAIVERPSLAESDERLHALATLARTEEDIAKALDVHRARPPGGRREENLQRNVGPDGVVAPLRQSQRRRGDAADRAYPEASHRGAAAWPRC